MRKAFLIFATKQKWNDSKYSVSDGVFEDPRITGRIWPDNPSNRNNDNDEDNN